jgi:hypothetical protein
MALEMSTRVSNREMCNVASALFGKSAKSLAIEPNFRYLTVTELCRANSRAHPSRCHSEHGAEAAPATDAVTQATAARDAV